MTALLERVKKRKVIQWTVAYTAVALTLIQLLDSFAGQFGIPTEFQRGVTIALVTGLIITIVLAWYHGERGPQSVPVSEFVLLGSVFAFGVISLWVMARPSTAATPEVPKATGREAARPGSIAVLAFDDFDSGDTGLRLGDAFQDEILNRLAQVQGLEPISRNSMVALRDARLPTPQIADSLRVRYMIEGSWQRAGDRVKVVAQLIEANRDVHLWSDSREFQYGDPFALQHDVASWVTDRVLAALSVGTAPDEPLRARDARAYEAYLEGRHWLNSRTQEDLTRALQSLERALQFDSTYAPAYAALAAGYSSWGTYGYGGPNAGYPAYGRAMALVDRAITLDPNLGEAHATRGLLLSKAYAPAEMVTPGFQRALQVLPASSEVRIRYAHFLTREQHYEEALTEAALAVRLDPVAPGRETALGWNALVAGQPEEALEAARRAAVLEPTLSTPRVISALALVLMDRAIECLELDLGTYVAVHAVCLDAAGRSDEARALVDSIADDPPAGSAGHHLATYYAWIGDANRALASLRSGFAETPHGLDFRVVQSPIFRRVMTDGGFLRGLSELRNDVWERVQRQHGISARATLVRQ